jgi:hypothetical protein
MHRQAKRAVPALPAEKPIGTQSALTILIFLRDPGPCMSGNKKKQVERAEKKVKALEKKALLEAEWKANEDKHGHLNYCSNCCVPVTKCKKTRTKSCQPCPGLDKCLCPRWSTQKRNHGPEWKRREAQNALTAARAVSSRAFPIDSALVRLFLPLVDSAVCSALHIAQGLTVSFFSPRLALQEYAASDEAAADDFAAESAAPSDPVLEKMLQDKGCVWCRFLRRPCAAAVSQARNLVLAASVMMARAWARRCR